MKVAIPTDDGVKVSHRFGRASGFLVAEVAAGSIRRRERRRNPVGTRGTARRAGVVGRHRTLSDLLSDCRVVITSVMGDSMRRALNRRGLEVIITSEPLVDRALALFSLAALKDESRVSEETSDLPDLADLSDDAEPADDPSAADDFDA